MRDYAGKEPEVGSDEEFPENLQSPDKPGGYAKVGEDRAVADLAADALKLDSSQATLTTIFALTAVNFPYGFICGTMGLMVLPTEGERLYASHHSLALGLSLAVVGVSQLVCPVSGRLSDSYRGANQWAKRRPFIVISTIVSSICCFGMLVASSLLLGFIYYLFLFIAMMALNILYSVQCGLVPDFLPLESSGRSSGAVAVLAVSGSAFGFITVLLTSLIDYHFLYILHIVFLTVAAVVVCKVSSRCQLLIDQKNSATSEQVEMIGTQALEENELPTSSTSATHQERTPHHDGGYRFIDRYFVDLTIADLWRCFLIDTSQGYDFLWIFVGRTTYYVGVSVQAFILYYLRDMIETPTEEERRIQVGCIALLAQGTAALVAYPVGRASDSGLNRKRVIYGACALMSVTYFGFMAAPSVPGPKFGTVLFSSLFYGVGNGCFLAVDYALALATIPDKSRTAQALGIWGVSAFLGSALGPLLWGALIELFGNKASGGRIIHAAAAHYQPAGYYAMLIGGVFATILAGLVIKKVQVT